MCSCMRACVCEHVCVGLLSGEYLTCLKTNPSYTHKKYFRKYNNAISTSPPFTKSTSKAQK